MGERVATWYLVAPEVMYRQNVVTRLAQLGWEFAFIVTDTYTADPSFVNKVKEQLPQAGIGSSAFGGVEPDPSLQTARIGSET